MGKLDGTDLTDSALHLHLCDAKHPLVVLAPVSGIDADFTQVFETKAFNKFNWQGKLGCSRIDQRLALNFLALPIRWQVTVLPIPHFYWNANTHASLIADFALGR